MDANIDIRVYAPHAVDFCLYLNPGDSLELVRAAGKIAEYYGYPYGHVQIEGEADLKTISISFSDSRPISRTPGYQKVEFEGEFCNLLYHDEYCPILMDRQGNRAKLIIHNVGLEALYDTEEDIAHLGYILTEANLCRKEFTYEGTNFGVPIFGAGNMFRYWPKSSANHPSNNPRAFWDKGYFYHIGKSWFNTHVYKNHL